MAIKTLPDHAPAIMAAICARLRDGEPLGTICKSPGMPNRNTVLNWVGVDDALMRDYQAARQAGADALIEQAQAIADTPLIGEETEDSTGKNGPTSKVRRADMLGHRKLQVWTRMQIAARLNPQKYGDRQHLAVTGGDGGAVVVASEAERAEQVAALVAMAQQRAQAAGGACPAGPAVAEPPEPAAELDDDFTDLV